MFISIFLNFYFYFYFYSFHTDKRSKGWYDKFSRLGFLIFMNPYFLLIFFHLSLIARNERKKKKKLEGIVSKARARRANGHWEGTSLCRSSFAWNSAPYDIPDMLSKPGTPCNDYNGYCDVFQRCREVIQPSIPLLSISCQSLVEMRQSFHILSPFIDLNYATFKIRRIFIIRQGGSQRAIGNSEKTTLVGRQPSKLPTMDDRSLVHRRGNYPFLTFDLGKFWSPIFFFSKVEKSFFFLSLILKRQGAQGYFKSIDFGYQDKNIE